MLMMKLSRFWLLFQPPSRMSTHLITFRLLMGPSKQRTPHAIEEKGREEDADDDDNNDVDDADEEAECKEHKEEKGREEGGSDVDGADDEAE